MGFFFFSAILYIALGRLSFFFSLVQKGVFLLFSFLVFLGPEGRIGEEAGGDIVYLFSLLSHSRSVRGLCGGGRVGGVGFGLDRHILYSLSLHQHHYGTLSLSEASEVLKKKTKNKPALPYLTPVGFCFCFCFCFFPIGLGIM